MGGVVVVGVFPNNRTKANCERGKGLKQVNGT